MIGPGRFSTRSSTDPATSTGTYAARVALRLTDDDVRRLDGGDGPAVRLAMRVVVRLAEALGAEELLDISGAHVDSCLYNGLAPLEFAELLAGDGATVVVPTTLNVSSLDLLHPDLYRGDPEEGDLARRQMDAFVAMGCRPTWTCAPYQLEQRPAFGEHVAWAESNAIAFANSVLGARTDRYGDLVDICAAITGRAPAAGLHLDENRRATVLFRLDALTPGLHDSSLLAPVLGAFIGSVVGNRVPVIDGLPVPPGEDWLKALGAAAASAGSVALFHVVGATPEAPTLETALGGVALAFLVGLAGHGRCLPLQLGGLKHVRQRLGGFVVVRLPLAARRDRCHLRDRVLHPRIRRDQQPRRLQRIQNLRHRRKPGTVLRRVSPHHGVEDARPHTVARAGLLRGLVRGTVHVLLRRLVSRVFQGFVLRHRFID